jgi:hypothetical protein
MLHSFETVEAAVANGTATEEVIRRIMGETIELVTGRKPYDPSIANVYGKRSRIYGAPRYRLQQHRPNRGPHGSPATPKSS